MHYEVDRVPTFKVMEYYFYYDLSLTVSINGSECEAQFLESIAHVGKRLELMAVQE